MVYFERQVEITPNELLMLKQMRDRAARNPTSKLAVSALAHRMHFTMGQRRNGTMASGYTTVSFLLYANNVPTIFYYMPTMSQRFSEACLRVC